MSLWRLALLSLIVTIATAIVTFLALSAFDDYVGPPDSCDAKCVSDYNDGFIDGQNDVREQSVKP